MYVQLMKAYDPTSRSAVSFSNSNFNLSLVHFCPPFSLVVKAFLQPSPPPGPVLARLSSQNELI